jgi:O-antigen/teichoic acid export membrane protein
MSLRRNTLWNIVGVAAPFLIGVVTIPYLIKTLGIEAFGVLTLIWALIGYFSLFDFGLGRALTQQISEAESHEQHQQIPELIKTGLGLTILTGGLGGLLLAGLSGNLANQWLNVGENLAGTTYHALLIAAVGIPLTTLTTGLRGILEAYDEFKAVNILRMLLGVANFVLPVICVFAAGPSLAWIVVTLVIARALVMLMHWWLVSRKFPGLLQAQHGKEKLGRLLPFGAWITISNIISPLMVSADRFVISSVLGATVVAFYTAPFEMLFRILIVPGALTSAMFPRLVRHLANSKEEARQLYKKCLLITAFLLFCICSVTALGSYRILDLWLGADFAQQGWAIVCILSLGMFFNGIAHVPFGLIQAAGDAKTTAQLHIFEFMLYVPALYLGLKTFGILGAPIAWTLRVLVDLIALLVHAKRVLSHQ